MKEQLLQRWRSLAAREQRLLLAGVGAVLLTVIFLGVLEPLVKAQVQREAALAQSRALAQRLEVIAADVRVARSSGAAPVSRTLSLLAALDQSVKQSGIGKPPSRIQPDGDKQAKVTFDSVSFDALARWLFDLESRYGVFTQNADIEREAAAGLVSAQLTLARP